MTPEIAVVVAAHDRTLRLRWLLEALAEQTLAPERWQLVVAHDAQGPETDRLLRTHRLHEQGRLTVLTFPPGPGPAEKRNAAWRGATAPLVAFTDDDCRPPPGWLEHLLEAARAHPGAIVQGTTIPDPDELGLVRAGGWRSQEIHPPTTWAQTCNIAYPREVLEATAGFDERLPVAAGEDTDLALRARAAGTPYVGAPEAVTYHCIEVPGLKARVKDAQRWRHMPYLAARHPALRRRFPLRIFWKPRHALIGPALAGLLLARRHPAWLALALPWARQAAPSYGPGPRGRARALAELPANALVDLAEVSALARGSVEHRSLLL